MQAAGAKDSNTMIKLPKIYTRKHLPVDKKGSATPKKTQE